MIHNTQRGLIVVFPRKMKRGNERVGLDIRFNHDLGHIHVMPRTFHELTSCGSLVIKERFESPKLNKEVTSKLIIVSINSEEIEGVKCHC
jgi:hypothetical protein